MNYTSGSAMALIPDTTACPVTWVISLGVDFTLHADESRGYEPNIPTDWSPWPQGVVNEVVISPRLCGVIEIGPGGWLETSDTMCWTDWSSAKNCQKRPDPSTSSVV